MISLSRKLLNRRALSPVIASVIIVAVTLSVAIAVAVYLSGISIYTRVEKLEISTRYVKSDGTVIIKAKNTGSTPLTIPKNEGVMINGIPFKDFDSGANVIANGKDLSKYDVKISPDETCRFEIKSSKFKQGVTYEIKIRTSTGKEYPSAIEYVGIAGTPPPTTSPPTTSPPTTTPPPTHCFIATACVQSDSSWALIVLREFRDKVLNSNPVTREFIKVYYTCSPPMAEKLSQHAILRRTVRYSLVYPAAMIAALILKPWILIISLMMLFMIERNEERIKSVLGLTSAFLTITILSATALAAGYIGYKISFIALIGASTLPFIIPAAVISVIYTLTLEQR